MKIFSKNQKIRRNEDAFTLLEVMVAVAIIAMSFVALLASQSQSISVAAVSRFETTASLLARQKLAELELDGFDSLGSGSGGFGDDFADWGWQAEVTELGEDETGIKGSEGLLKLIRLEVNQGGGDTFELRSVVMAQIEPAEGQ